MADVSKFSTADDGRTYVRKLFGFESSTTSYHEPGDGLFFYTGSCSVQLPPGVPLGRLRRFVALSWVRLRHLAPSIGLTTFRRPGDTDWFVEYRVPQSHCEVEAWANNVIVWHVKQLPLVAWDSKVAHRVWKPSTGHSALELHVCPESRKEGKWHFCVHGPHGMIDGRMAMALLDRMLLILILEGYIQCSAPPAEAVLEIKWGTEVDRLHGCAASCVDDFVDVLAKAVKESYLPSVAPAKFIPFLPSPIENQEVSYDSTSRLFKLSKDQTKEFRALCKSHGCTVTQVVDSVFTLADTEASLTAAKARGPQRWKTVVDAYEQATSWLFALTLKDQRPSFSAHSALSPASSPFYAIDALSFGVDMALIRKALCLDKKSQTFERSISDAVFWNGLVQNYIKTRNQQKVDHESFVKRELSQQKLSEDVDIEPLRIRTFASSSLGDIDRLGFFTDAQCSLIKGVTKRTIKVVEVLHGCRIILPFVSCVYWQFNGRLSIYFTTGARYQTEAEMDIMVDCLRNWFDALLA